MFSFSPKLYLERGGHSADMFLRVPSQHLDSFTEICTFGTNVSRPYGPFSYPLTNTDALGGFTLVSSVCKSENSLGSWMDNIPGEVVYPEGSWGSSGILCGCWRIYARILLRFVRDLLFCAGEILGLFVVPRDILYSSCLFVLAVYEGLLGLFEHYQVLFSMLTLSLSAKVPVIKGRVTLLCELKK